MGLVITKESELGKELAKWETPRDRFVLNSNGESTDVKGMKCVGFEPYPKMLYMARQTTGGQWRVTETAPQPYALRTIDDYQRAENYVEAFNKSCQKIVHSEEEHRREKDNGWRDSPQDAMDYRTTLEDAVAYAAAERHHSDQRLSEKAREEADHADAGAGLKHLAEVPRTPIVKRRKYERKAKPVETPVTE